MRNLLLKLRFNGAKYHGWQIQNNAKTVQGEIQSAVDRIFKDNSPVYGCSRTDTGVHANEYFCNFHTNKDIPCDKVISAINANIDDDIAVVSCKDVDADFHARYSCKGKQYKYTILNSSVRDPFLNSFALQYKYHLDENKLNELCKMFVGKHDFSAFCATGSSVESNVRTVFDASVIRRGDLVIFTVSADGFLYNMVRIMVGTLLKAQQENLSCDDIKSIIDSKSRENAGITVVGDGLVLDKVFYDEVYL